jgi:hypothetical protein
MAAHLHPVAPGALPRDLAAGAAEVFGRVLVIEWCEELLAGRAADDDPAWPAISWLGGTVGWAPSWARTWGARGLVHIGPPARPEIVFAALEDESWRVREMSLKVIRRHGLDDPDGLVDRLVDDPAERVCIQAWMALGLPVPHEQQA